MKKVLFFFAAMFLALGSTWLTLDQMFAKQGGIGHLSSAIEAIRLRSANPTMHPDAIEKEAAKANQGALGLLKTLKNGATNGLGAPTSGTGSGTAPVSRQPDAYVRVADDRNAILNAPDNVKTTAELHELSAGGQNISVQGTADGRDVVAVVHDPTAQDFNAIERIKALNIPDDLKEKILRNYEMTGVVPDILVNQRRAPAAAPPSDDY
jgi:hypothetical protein